MKGLVLTHIGLEKVSADEVRALVSASDVETRPGRVLFSVESAKDLATLCYRGRTFVKVVRVLSEFRSDEMPSPDNLPDVKAFLGGRAAIDCDRTGEHAFTSFDVQQEWNQALAKKYGVTIDHKNPQSRFYLLIDGSQCLFGVDMAGIDLGRREYRIFLGTDALKGSVAAGLLMIAGYEPGQVLLDPFCRHGIVPIEAALMATNTSPHKLAKEKLGFTKLPGFEYGFRDEPCDFTGTIIAMDDNFKHVSASKKNAKIAGVTKLITFSRTDLEWMDAKFGKHFLDRIVTLPVQPSRSTSEQKIRKAYHELFYQADFILKSSGKLCLCMKRGVELVKQKAEEFKFAVEKECAIMQGKEGLTVLVFSKGGV